eukprot:scaffold58823_cov31-Tisochrysis_lutea.AAC.1
MQVSNCNTECRTLARACEQLIYLSQLGCSQGIIHHSSWNDSAASTDWASRNGSVMGSPLRNDSATSTDSGIRTDQGEGKSNITLAHLAGCQPNRSLLRSATCITALRGTGNHAKHSERISKSTRKCTFVRIHACWLHENMHVGCACTCMLVARVHECWLHENMRVGCASTCVLVARVHACWLRVYMHVGCTSTSSRVSRACLRPCRNLAYKRCMTCELSKALAHACSNVG